MRASPEALPQKIKMKITEEFGFLKYYIGKKLTGVETTPYWSEKKRLTSSNTVVIHTNAGPLYFSCSPRQADLFYEENEDVLFTVSEQWSETEYSALDDIPLGTEKRDETIIDISLVYDEVSALNRNDSEKILTYPVAVTIATYDSVIGVWRDSMDVSLIGYEGECMTGNRLWPVDELWGDYFGVPPFSVKRTGYSYYEGGPVYSEEKKFFPSSDGARPDDSF